VEFTHLLGEFVKTISCRHFYRKTNQSLGVIVVLCSKPLLLDAALVEVVKEPSLQNETRRRATLSSPLADGAVLLVLLYGFAVLI
jgi:hypothetical protein